MTPVRRPWYAVAAAGLIVGASLLAIGANLPRDASTTTVEGPRTVYTVTAHPTAVATKASVPVPCKDSLHWANESVKVTNELGLIYSRNQTIISETHVAIGTGNLKELNRLAGEQNKLYNEIGPLNDALAQANLQYAKVQPACLSALH